MGECKVTYLEVRFIIEEELTQAYFFIEAKGDCPVQVHGWHWKTFPKSVGILDIMEKIKKGEEDPILWSLNAPLS